jgi:hypothetical protein
MLGSDDWGHSETVVKQYCDEHEAEYEEKERQREIKDLELSEKITTLTAEYEMSHSIEILDKIILFGEQTSKVSIFCPACKRSIRRGRLNAYLRSVCHLKAAGQKDQAARHQALLRQARALKHSLYIPGQAVLDVKPCYPPRKSSSTCSRTSAPSPCGCSQGSTK